MDALENIHINYPPASLSDVPEQVSHVYGLAIGIKNTSKCTMGSSYGTSTARDSIKIAAALVGGEEELRKKPTIAGYVDPVSPLTHDKEMTEGLLEYASYGQPIFIMVMALAGATGPATLAGILVQQNAEILSGLLIAHLVNPRVPVIYGTVSCPMDMRTGIASQCPELGLISAADAQASYEKTMSLIMAVMAGADLIDLFAGSMESYRTTSYEQMVIDNELAGMALRCAEGIEVNDDTLAVDVIRKVGPGGHFLAEKHTLDNLWKEHWMPKISDRKTFEAWEEAGAKDIIKVTREKVREILASHKPEPIPKDVQEEISQILKRYEKESLKEG